MNSFPRIVEKILSLFCRGELLEEILGDLEEYYYELEDRNWFLRFVFFWFQVINFLRPFALREITSRSRFNFINLYKNYFKTSIRGLKKNPLSSLINIIGLSIAIGVALVTYAFFRQDYKIDRFHKNKDKVFLATFHVDRNGENEHFGITQAPLANYLKEDFPQIRHLSQIADSRAVVSYDQNSFHESVRFVHPSFLSMFSFPLKWGVSNTLKKRNTVIISERTSQKYFGDENPVGQTLMITTEDGECDNYAITGVAKEFPKAHIIDFDFLINIDHLQNVTTNSNWNKIVDATFIMLDDPTQIDYISSCMGKYVELQNSMENNWPVSNYEFIALNDLHFRARDLVDSVSFDDNEEARKGTPFIAILILLLACFNYINIAIVSAARRLKEIGMRKVIGASRGQIIFQFLSENLVLTSIAIIIGFILCITLFNPGMKELSLGSWDNPLEIADPVLWLFIGGLLFTTGVISGIYPSIYISKFETVTIFRGSVKFGRKNLLTKTLLGIQLVITCTAIAIAIMFAKNSDYQNLKSWGYNQQNMIYAHVPNNSAYDIIANELEKNPNIIAVSGAKDHFGKARDSTVVHYAGKSHQVTKFEVDADYPKILEITPVEGELFNPSFEANEKSILVNESFVNHLGLENPISSSIIFEGDRFRVIGVVKDFHTEGFFRRINPSVIKVANPDERRYLVARVNHDYYTDTFIQLRNLWAELYPNIPFIGGYQEDVWGDYFSLLEVASKFYRILAIIAIILSSLGLYGLVSLNIAGRYQEFSIRKVMGAGKWNLASLVTNEYVVLALVSICCGIPVSYILIKASLDLLYAYPMPMSPWGIIIAVALLLLVILSVIFSQIRKVISTNPADGLKVES